MRVVVLHTQVSADAPPEERDTLVEVEAVGAALRELGHTDTAIPVSLDLEALRSRLAQDPPDVVFNLVEALGDSDRLAVLVPALLDSLRQPYTGAPAEATFLTIGKLLTKRWLRQAGIPTPEWFTPDDLRAVAEPLPCRRYIVKAVYEHASVGLDEESVLQTDCAADLLARCRRLGETLGGPAFAEAFVDGREFNLSLLAGPDGPEVLPLAEIDFVGYTEDRPRVVGYRAKWMEDSAEYGSTPRRFDFPPADGPLLERLRSTARRCWDVFGLDGYARVDFRVDEAGLAHVLEINTNPCLSPDGGFAAAVAAAGLTYPQAIARILAAALAHGPTRGHAHRTRTT